jgi:hypothetical protein
MGVSLVYLGRNDEPARPNEGLEMHEMCKAIAGKLKRASIQIQETNFRDGKNLPNANTVIEDDVWFCGHCRFVEADKSIRKTGARTLGGFPINEIAEFSKSCVTRGRKKIRLICCESAQQERYVPENVGESPAGFKGVLGNEFLESLTNPKQLRHFNRKLDARVSHLEELILAMAELWGNDRNTNQPEFDICGLWGAGDITGDNVPITSFLQDNDSLGAAARMDDKNVGQLQRNAAAIVFDNAHCKNKGLPDFFGYSIRHNLLVEWAQQQWKICLVVFDCNKKKGSEKMAKDLPVWVKLPNAKAVLDLKPEKVWRIFQNYAEKPNCPIHGKADCMQGELVVTTSDKSGFAKFSDKKRDVKLIKYYDEDGKIRNAQ